MVEVQCSSCHTRYRIDEQVLPEGTPTFKCSRCGHVFSLEPRNGATEGPVAAEPPPAPNNSSAGAAQNGEAVHVSNHEAPQTVAAPRPPSPSVANGTKSADSVSAPAPRSVTEELLARPFRTNPEASAGGENLAFDFRDEPATLDGDVASNGVATIEKPPKRTRRPAASGWEVGEVPVEPEKPRSRFKIGAAEFGDIDRDPEADEVISEDDFVDESTAPVYNRDVIHSSRYIVGLLFIVGVCFAAATLAIHNAPAAALEALNHIPVLGQRFASPLTPARMVALHDIHTSYQRSRDGRNALIVQGAAENVSGGTLRSIKIEAALGPANLDRREIYCGNNLATRSVSQMTLHEIDFFQKLAPHDFALAPSESCPFMVVFPEVSGAAHDFTLAVAEANTGLTEETTAAQ